MIAPAHLKRVEIIRCKIEELSEDFFKNSSNIEEIILSENSLKLLPKDIFVDQILLKHLDLSENSLGELVDGFFDTTIDLRILHLNSNKLRSISRNLFDKLGKLEILSLNDNELTTIDISFRSLTNLREVDLRFNQLSQNKTHLLFIDLNKLEKINLSYNKLEYFSISDFRGFNQLRIIDLSFNNFQFFDYKILMIPYSNDLIIDLSLNNISDFKMKDVLKYLNKKRYISHGNQFIVNYNPLNCDCNSLELIQFVRRQIEPQSIYKAFDFNVNDLRCQQPKNLLDRLVRSLNTFELVCEIEDCPVGCLCHLRSVDDSIIFNCSYSKHQQLPTLPKYENLNLKNIELNASNSQIQSIHLRDIPDNLKLLDLRNNSLKNLEDEVIKRFERIEKIYLSGNAWTCDCDAIKFIRFYHISRSNIVDADEMICANERPFKTLSTKDFCIQRIELLVLFFMVTSILGFTSVFYVVNNKKIKMWLYAHNCCLWWVSEEEADKDMIYDAFFVFSHFDDSFVTDLILDLELKAFKCCVHHRDWPAGEMIVTLALQSIRTSRRIIVVLSPMFLRSNWATWEFRVSLIHAFKERRSRVLVIIYGDPSLIDDLDEDLKTYVRYNTYLDSEDKWFEEKLFYAMPHKENQLQNVNKSKKKPKPTSSELLNIELQGINNEFKYISSESEE